MFSYIRRYNTLSLKKIFFLFVVFIINNRIAFSQIDIGIKVGGNYCNVTSSNSQQKNSFIVGYHAGAFVRYHFNKFLSLQPEAAYATKGFKYLYHTEYSASYWFFSASGSTDSHGQYNLSYIDVPLLANAHFGAGGNSYIGLGPQFSFILGANWDGETTTTATIPWQSTQTTTTPNSGSGTQGFNTVDFGAVIGAGTKIGGDIDCSLRAGYGFSDVSGSSSTNISSGHNLVFSLSVAYLFSIKK